MKLRFWNQVQGETEVLSEESLVVQARVQEMRELADV